jgi:hypothetical protein
MTLGFLRGMKKVERWARAGFVGGNDPCAFIMAFGLAAERGGTS